MRLRAATPKPRTAATIATEIASLDEIAGERAKALAALEGQRPALIEAADIDAVEALDSRIRRARIEAEVDSSKRAKLAAEYAEAKAVEDRARDQAERRAAYAAAQDAAEAARKLYQNDYPRLARELVALLSRTSESRKQVQAANERLPDGAAPIPLDFEPSRGRTAIPSRTTEVRRHVWVHVKSGKTSVLAPTEEREAWRKEVRTEEIEVEGVGAIEHVPLEDLVSLPGLSFGDSPFWTPQPVGASTFRDWRNFIRHPPESMSVAPALWSSSRSGR